VRSLDLITTRDDSQLPRSGSHQKRTTTVSLSLSLCQTIAVPPITQHQRRSRIRSSFFLSFLLSPFPLDNIKNSQRQLAVNRCNGGGADGTHTHR
jgi:hypothetical protein